MSLSSRSSSRSSSSESGEFDYEKYPSLESLEDDQSVDFWSSTSEEENEPIDEVDLSTFDAYLPGELWVKIAGSDLQTYQLLSGLSLAHYQALKLAWKQITYSLTDYPILNKNENDRAYCYRVGKEIGIDLAPEWQDEIKQLRVNKKFDILFDKLLKSVHMYELEKLVKLLINNLPKEVLNKHGIALFHYLGVSSRKRTDMVDLLLRLSEDMPEDWRQAAVRAGYHSFVIRSSLQPEVRHNGEVLVRLLNKRSLIDFRSIAVGMECFRILNEAETEVIINGSLNYIPDKSSSFVEDELYFAHIFDELLIKQNMIRFANVISILLEALPATRRQYIANILLHTANAEIDCFNATNDWFALNGIELPPRMIRVRELMARGSNDFVPQTRQGIVHYAKALFTYISTFSTEEIANKLTELPLTEENTNQLGVCLTLALAANLDINKIELIINLIPENNRVNMIVTALTPLISGVAAELVRLDNLIMLLDRMKMLDRVLTNFLQLEIKTPDFVGFMNNVPAINWQELLEAFLEAFIKNDLTGKTNLVLVFSVHKSNSYFHDALTALIKKEASNTKMISKLFREMPDLTRSYYYRLACVYLHQIIINQQDVKYCFKAVNYYYAGKEGEIIHAMSAYDIKHGTSITASFLSAFRKSAEVIDLALRLADNNDRVKFHIWHILSDKLMKKVLVSSFSQFLDHHLGIFNTLPRNYQNSILLAVLLQRVSLINDEKKPELLKAAEFFIKNIGISSDRFISVAAATLFTLLDMVHFASYMWPEVDAFLLSFYVDSVEYINIEHSKGCLSPILRETLVFAAKNNDSNKVEIIVGMEEWSIYGGDDVLSALFDGSLLNGNEKTFLRDQLTYLANLAANQIINNPAPRWYSFYKSSSSSDGEQASPTEELGMVLK